MITPDIFHKKKKLPKKNGVAKKIVDRLFLSFYFEILNLSKSDTSPSRALFMMDPLVPLNLVNQCRSLYLSSNCQVDKDPFISPLIAATDEVLAKFPPTSFVVGSFDPFFDDCNINFAYLDSYLVSLFCKLRK